MSRPFLEGLRVNPHIGEPSRLKSSFAERLRLNHGILDNAYWVLPIDPDDKLHLNYMQVGHDLQKSGPLCGLHKSFSVCKNVEGHKGVFLHGVDCTDKVVVRQNHLWCNKSSCPVCFSHGWATRRARVIAGRVLEGERLGLGKPEHIMVSPSPADANFQEDVIRPICRKALLVRGVNGGCMMFHGYRIDEKRHCLAWGAHYHVVGFIEGGYTCRDCTKTCSKGCGGFVDRSYRCNEKDGCIVKVEGERKTIVGTAWYQAHHCTIRLGVRRFHVVTWYGVCGNRKYKSEKLKAEALCPACEGDMTTSVHVGSRHIVKDIGSPEYRSVFTDVEFDGDSLPNYIDSVGSPIE